MCAVPRRMIFCSSFILLVPGIFPKFWSIPSLISPSAPTITGTVSVLTPHILVVSISRSLYFESFSIIIIKAGGFWARGVTAFFDVRVTHVNSKCYQSKPTSEVFKEQEEEKKRKYQQRVLDVEMSSFTPLVFGTNGGMGNECQRFLKHLADKIAQKDTEPYHVVITWLRTQISFELLRSVHACVRGSRTPFRSKIEQSLDCKINVASADI